MIIFRKLDISSLNLIDLKKRVFYLLIYFICFLGAWIIVRTIVDIVQLRPQVHMFLLEDDKTPVKPRKVDLDR